MLEKEEDFKESMTLLKERSALKGADVLAPIPSVIESNRMCLQVRILE